jgi:hypothetical protein
LKGEEPPPVGGARHLWPSLMSFALLLKLDGIDIAFIAAVTIVSVVLILVMNPLSSWVGKLLDYQKKKSGKP